MWNFCLTRDFYNNVVILSESMTKTGLFQNTIQLRENHQSKASNTWTLPPSPKSATPKFSQLRLLSRKLVPKLEIILRWENPLDLHLKWVNWFLEVERLSGSHLGRIIRERLATLNLDIHPCLGTPKIAIFNHTLSLLWLHPLPKPELQVTIFLLMNQERFIWQTQIHKIITKSSRGLEI